MENPKDKTGLLTSDYYYELPPELIAQHPAERRDASRLLVINRASGSIEHRRFSDIVECLNPPDVLVINDSKVIPARLIGCVAGGDAPVELLLLREREPDIWETLSKPGKRARAGMRLTFGKGILSGEVLSITDDGNRIIRFEYDKNKYKNLYEILDRIGLVPLPPYITEPQQEEDRYQTVYARYEGSVAAPTAGLHFTPELLDKIREKGVAIVPVMLHVGLGTFRPVKEKLIEMHVMHTEYFSVSGESARIINERRAAGGRIISVGTTSCRTLESAADSDGVVHAMSGETGIFIYPGYKFKATDALITNFHLPESTLLMLVSAFWSREEILRAYEIAVKEKYRFYSFGDAMLIQ
ncbi:MAG: tRNA preQ1(34) S-adenosylmethionine ribosyltransferase-isomerase QueA [Eubacteriales bacterium]|jgi:S-adenosylmethionine:tRNA ribosyltransferase-isomerase